MSKLITNTIRHTGGSADNITLDNSQNVTVEGNLTVDGTTTITGYHPTTSRSNRNLVINGAMQVAQRGTSSTSDGYQAADRWWWGKYNTDQLATTHSQVTDAPEGFKNSYKIDVTTAETALDSDEWGPIRYRIEGQDLQHLKTGTSNAVTTTLSFYAKTASGNSGDTYSVCIVHGDSSGNDRSQHRTFTPTSTWQRFTMSFVGHTAISIRNDNDYGLQLFFILAAGSSKVTSATTTWGTNGEKGVTGQSNFFDSTSNEFFVTGVQLEVGSTATDFEHLSYADELVKCHRYYWKWVAGASYNCLGVGWAPNSSRFDTVIMFPQTMRASPSFSTGGSFRASTATASPSITPTAERTGNHTAYLRSSSISGLTAGEGGEYGANNDGSAYVAFDAEL